MKKKSLLGQGENKCILEKLHTSETSDLCWRNYIELIESAIKEVRGNCNTFLKAGICFQDELARKVKMVVFENKNSKTLHVEIFSAVFTYCLEIIQKNGQDELDRILEKLNNR